MLNPQWILPVQALILGLVLGSFLNVCIYRLPLGLTVLGRSVCPRCSAPIPLYRNIPLLSFILQKGKSHCCAMPISSQYPVVEALTGFVSILTFYHSHSLPEYFLWFLLFMCPLIIVSIIDLKLKIIPDVISLPFILVGIGVTLFTKYPDWIGALKFSALGILIGGGSLLLIAEVVSRLKKTEAMGGGDIKLSAMLGAFLGWKAIIFVFFASSVLTLAYAVFRIIFDKNRRGETIPFGPFLSLAAMIFWLYGRQITDLYFFSSGFGRNPFFE